MKFGRLLSANTMVKQAKARLFGDQPFGPPDPHAGWWACECGALLNPMDKRWRDLQPVAKLLATGWVERMGRMVCPRCRQLPGT